MAKLMPNKSRLYEKKEYVYDGFTVKLVKDADNADASSFNRQFIELDTTGNLNQNQLYRLAEVLNEAIRLGYLKEQ